MSNFTQLNLQGNNSNRKTEPNPTTPSNKLAPKKPGLKPEHGGAKAAAIVGSFMAATLIATFTIGTNGCTKSKSAAVSTPTPAITQPAVPVMTPTPSPAVKTAKKSPRQHKLATFKSPDYGLSFRYPVHYMLKEGEETDVKQTNVESAAMNFVQPGGSTLSTVELPETLYTGTDFTSAFFTVNVNPRMTADECGQFAFPENSELDNNSSGPAQVNVSGTDYTEIDDLVSDGSLQANAHYYHVYQNNVCYEFALGLQTAGDDTNKELKAVNRDKVFDKLTWMLSTVKIKPTTIPEVSASTPAANTEAANQ